MFRNQYEKAFETRHALPLLERRILRVARCAANTKPVASHRAHMGASSDANLVANPNATLSASFAASLTMNKTAIPLEALNRFRAAASHYTPTAKSRASRLLTLKDDIAVLRKRGISYRAIGELLTQTGIPSSDTCVTNFCHRVLKEKIAHKSSAKRSASRPANRPASPKSASLASPKTTLPTAPATTGKTTPLSADNASFTSRGPHIAKVELLNPDE